MKTKIIHISFILALFSCKDSSHNKEKITISENQTLELDTESISSDLNNFKIENTGVNEFWKNLNPKKVKLFVYTTSHKEGSNDHFKSHYIVNKKNALNPNTIDAFTKELSQDSIKILMHLLANTTNYWDSPADCFNPRHGIVFYGSQNKITGHISVCFACNSYLTQPQVVNHVPMDWFEKMFKQHGFPIKDGMIRKYLKENPNRD